MSIQNVLLGETEQEVMVAHFDGSGDIFVSAGCFDKEMIKKGLVMFFQDTPRAIGSEHPELIGKNVDQIIATNPLKIMLQFAKPESVDVVIKMLQEVKESLIKNTVQV